MTKADLRREMRARLKMPGETRAGKSRAIAAAIAAHRAFIEAETIALFDPLPSEPDISALFGKPRAGEKSARRFCYPQVIAEDMALIEVRSQNELLPAGWNPHIREPANDPARIVAPAGIQLILVPGLAFTRAGQRLGRGGGHYDRLLEKLPPHAVKMGVCFDMQIVPGLALEIHDQSVDFVITETSAA